jgi:predicted acyltransferase
MIQNNLEVVSSLGRTTPRVPTTRITSIDALRGLTIAFMILVNDPGDWAHVYPPLDHAPWNGFTPTDLVFPMFLFLVGCSIVFSIDSRLAKGVPKRAIALQIVRRAAIIFAIKVFLSAYPHFNLTNLRVYGVLTRIALCYLLAGLLFLYVRSTRALIAIAAALLFGYWLLLRFVPIPGIGLPVRDFPILDPDRNLAAWIDRAISDFTLRTIHLGRLYQKTRDPEGFLSTLPAVATTLLGILAALYLRPKSRVPRVSNLRHCIPLLLAGLISLTLGLLWNPWFPINKNLWTSSYVLFSGGWSLLLLALFYMLFDRLQLQQRSHAVRAFVWPLLVYGSNAIAAFVISEFIVLSLIAWKLPPAAAGARPQTAWAWLYTHIFATHGSSENTSLAFALAYVVVCFLPNWLLSRRKIFLRV